MQWLSELPFGDNRAVQMAVLAVCVIAVLVGLAALYRLMFANRLRVPGGRTRQPRLGLVDAFSLDGQRQLVLIRRDNIEHLVMIGGPNDVLVESQINRALAPAREAGVPPAPPPRRRAESAATALAAQPAGEAAPAQPATAVATTAPQTVTPPTGAAAPQPQTPRPQPMPAAAPTPPAPSAAPVPAPATARPAALTPAAAKPPELARPVPAPPASRPVPPRSSMPPPIAPPASIGVSGPPGAPPPTVAQPVAPRVGAAQPARPEQRVDRDGRGKTVGAASPTPATPPSAEPPATAAPRNHFAPALTESPAAKPDAGSLAPDGPSARQDMRPPPPTPPRGPAFPSPIQAQLGPRVQVKSEPKADPPPSLAAQNPSKPPVMDEAPPSETTPDKDDDPFTDLGSLEAEMARLLGRVTRP
jgi:flagellar protein FliO/FliZ